MFDKLTDKVSIEFLDEHNLTRFNRIGIPLNVYDLSGGIKWKPLSQISDEDRETLDQYFDVVLQTDLGIKQKIQQDFRMICDAMIVSEQISGSRYASLVQTNMELTMAWFVEICKLVGVSDMYSGDFTPSDNITSASQLSHKLDILIHNTENYEFVENDYPEALQTKIAVAEINIVSNLCNTRIWLRKFIVEQTPNEDGAPSVYNQNIQSVTK